MARYSIDTPECPRRRIATRVDGTLYYVHSDHPSTSSGHSLGSTVAVSDAAGQAVGRVQYDPYGEVITSTLPLTPEPGQGTTITAWVPLRPTR